jgi:UDP-N-acetylglucosamine 4,6-dehydratase
MKYIDFNDRIVLITGGTGSFGRYIVERLLETDVDEIRIFSRDEEKQLDMQRKITDERMSYYIGDVRDYNRINEAMDMVDTVYHAAALKIITTGELNPDESIKTNIIGTQNVKRACIENLVEEAIFVSTDKAVKPINLYGMTKGVAEKIWIYTQVSSCPTNFSAVRYGNVVGSRGSIIPFFKQLKHENKALPITDPSMTRFLITLEQAIDLVFEATGEDGVILVPNIPAANVMDIVEAVAGKDYHTLPIGIRPGEKIHECLINEFELMHTYANRENTMFTIDNSATFTDLAEEFTSDTARRLTISEIRELL